MKITAINLIIHWDQGQMVILNPGETGELSDALAAEEIAGGNAEPANPLDHDGDGESGGSEAATGDNIASLRALYQEVLGKKPFPGWDADELQRRIDAADQAPA